LGYKIITISEHPYENIGVVTVNVLKYVVENYVTTYYSKTCLKRTPIYRKPGQTENKFRNGVISHVK